MGPGTKYTRTGPEGDPIGRLADFSRFIVDELNEIETQACDTGAWTSSGTLPSTRIYAGAIMHRARELARYLNGYTTTAD